jgi:hypothetical protein
MTHRPDSGAVGLLFTDECKTKFRSNLKNNKNEKFYCIKQEKIASP